MNPFAQLLATPRPLVMGILNVTPDSFSDGGRFRDPTAALDHARAMVAEGADILDIGGESTRPYGGAAPVSAEEEWARIGDLLTPLVALGKPVSVDTMKAAVAKQALARGVTIVNDVWGLQHDTDMARVVADHDCGLVAMHNREKADAADIMADIENFFRRTLDIADRAGIARERIVLDPGIGFGKTQAQSIAVLGQLDRLRSFGLPLLVGASRKRFIASVSPSEPQERIGGSIAAALIAAKAGARIIRVHDVAATVQALRVAQAIEASGER
jgi:dihydropteroate synthase